jgi:hypothetical protein
MHKPLSMRSVTNQTLAIYSMCQCEFRNWKSALLLLVSCSLACGGSSMSSGPPPNADASVGDSAAIDGGAIPTCYADDDCAHASCVFGAGCPGACAPYLEAGARCFANEESSKCDPDAGLACDPFSHACKVPQPPVIVGAGLPCSISGSQCDTGLFCAGTFPTSGTCRPIAAEGGACVPSYGAIGCVSGLLCVGFGTTSANGTCRRPTASGGACVAGDPAQGSSGCDWGLACVNAVCVVPPSTGACLSASVGFQCDPHVSYCDATTQMCRLLGNVSSPCTSQTECVSGLFCDRTNHCGTTVCPRP